MDLLASLGLGTALPEQSTRLTSHPGIIKALEEGDVRLGFNKCLTCGVNLNLMEVDTKKKQVVSCKGCNRVSYCSSNCRTLDAQEESTLNRSNDDEIGIGHSPVICSLLNLCNDDESVEEELMHAKNKNIDSSNKADQDMNNKKREEAAKYRIQTELESYPATLFNILAESPQWFIECMTKRLRYNEDVRSPQRKIMKRRRGKRDRDSISSPIRQQLKGGEEEEEGMMKKRQKELVLHIVGASSESELWGWNGTSNSKNDNNKRQQYYTDGDDDEDGSSNNNMPDVINAYAEASTNLTSYLNTLLESSISIRCIFIGPDCPSSPTTKTMKQHSQQTPCHNKVNVAIPDSNSSTLTIETFSCYYGSSDQPYLPPPDVIILFNPGFSCTDYNWSTAISAACAYNSNNNNNTIPFLITTNTEMEGYADIKYLLDGRYMDDESVPRDILEAIDYGSNKISGKNGEDDDNNDTTFSFSENPYAGLRVRQSGTMGNDLFVKNRWIIGGLLSSSSSSSFTRSSDTPSTLDTTYKKKKKRKNESTTKNEGGEKKARKRHRTSATPTVEGNDDDGVIGHTTNTGGNKNSKKRNPCLI